VIDAERDESTCDMTAVTVQNEKASGIGGARREMGGTGLENAFQPLKCYSIV